MTDRADRSVGLGEGEPGVDRNEGGLIGVENPVPILFRKVPPRLIVSPPLEWGSQSIVALLFDSDTHVGDGELQVFSEAVRGRAEAAGAPVVDRRDGDAQIRGQLADIDQGLQVPRGGLRFGVHDGQMHGTHRS